MSSVTGIDESSIPLTDELVSILEHLNILLDSNIIIGRSVSEKAFLLLEVYKRRASDGPVKKRIGNWSEGRGLRMTTSPVVAARRMNLHKALIRAVMVVSTIVKNISWTYLVSSLCDSVTTCPQVTDNGTMNHLEDNVDKHIDTYTKTNYAQFKYVAEVLNAR